MAIAAVVLVVATGLPALQASAGVSTPAAAAFTVTPNTLLLNNQFVTAAGTDYPAGTQIGIVQCKTDPGGQQGCDLSTLDYVTSDGAGAFSVGYQVKRVIRVGADSIDCALAGACIVGAGVVPDGIPAANATIQFDPSVPLPPPPTLTADPNTDLLNNQVVTLTGSNYEPDISVGVVQCRTGSPGPQNCDLSTLQFVSPATDGTFTFPYTVRRLINVDGETIDCAQPGVCEIGAGSSIDNGAQAPIQFDPDQPLPPPLSLTASPNSGLVDGQTITVIGRNFPPGEAVVFQCPTPPPGSFPENCVFEDLLIASVGADGSFSTPLVLSQELEQRDGPDVDCAQPNACVVFSAPYNDPFTSATASLSFGSPDPGAPPGPSPAGAVNQVPLVTPTFTG